MIDARLAPLQKAVLGLPARWLAARGVLADHVSLVGFGLGVLAVPALAFGAFGLALALLAANRIADGLDGAIARATVPTDRGAFLDIGLDFVFYAIFPLGFALADPAANALPAAVLIASFIGSGSSFLAFASIAAKRGKTAADYPNKGIYYLGGLTEGAPETNPRAFASDRKARIRRTASCGGEPRCPFTCCAISSGVCRPSHRRRMCAPNALVPTQLGAFGSTSTKQSSRSSCTNAGEQGSCSDSVIGTCPPPVARDFDSPCLVPLLSWV